VRAKKSLGQNFLVDPNIQRKIVAAANAGPDSDVLEIGPGHGALTRHIAGTVRQLTVIELDRELAATLRTTFGGRDDVLVLEQDILETPLDTLPGDASRRIVIGNIPYSITTPILFHLLRREWRPAHIVLMVQREVADRITATAGGDYGALSMGVQSVARVERLFRVSRRAFRPVPNVDSTVLRITPVRPFPLSAAEETDLRSLTLAAFGWRRKQLQRTLRSAPAYRLAADDIRHIEEQTGLDLECRPEALPVDAMIRLARDLRRAGWPAPGSP
jgi:16S rRNA (adenine1518-N6/adenine1519-N6)-dimethyltransferase